MKSRVLLWLAVLLTSPVTTIPVVKKRTTITVTRISDKAVSVDAANILNAQTSGSAVVPVMGKVSLAAAEENEAALALPNAATVVTAATNIANTATSVTSAAAKKTSSGTKASSTKASSSSKTSTASTSKPSRLSLPKSIGNIEGDLKDFEKPTKKFQDGKIKCLDFPSGQGVIKLPWIGRSGWASITDPSNGNTSTTCQDGWLCSYACQPGMSKTQWPSKQPASGESRGGLLCKGGYLYRTNTKQEYLCEWGLGTNYAVSKLDKVLSLCRTDYPGSENMNIPTRLLSGDKKPMSSIIEDGYYTWQGGKTSAQYYVNNAGIDVDEGCLWGNASATVGNWAPVVLGSGYVDNKTWLLIIPNPNNKAPPNYNVKIVAEKGAKLQGDCWYVDGKYSGSQGQESDGCTTAVEGGTANFVFSPRSK